jgi:hypothetical protein
LSQKNGCGTSFLVPQLSFLGGNRMNNKKLILALVALVLVVGVFAGVWFATRPESTEGTKTFTVQVVHADKTERTFSYTASKGKLGAFLETEGLIVGSGDGMFHTVDGEKADWNTNQSYWAFYLNGEYATAGIYDTDIVDGTAYKLEYTLG